MKKFVVATVFAAGIGVIAFASLKKTTSNKQGIEKKVEKQKVKKECSHQCMFS